MHLLFLIFNLKAFEDMLKEVEDEASSSLAPQNVSQAISQTKEDILQVPAEVEKKTSLMPLVLGGLALTGVILTGKGK